MANDNPFQNFDPSQWFSQFDLPTLDINDIMDQTRKDWEAFQHANQAATEGWQKLAQRQQELIQEAMEGWQQNLTESISRAPQQNAEQIRANVEKAMSNIRELAEIVTQSQTEAAEILRKRFEENLARINHGANEKE